MARNQWCLVWLLYLLGLALFLQGFLLRRHALPHANLAQPASPARRVAIIVVDALRFDMLQFDFVLRAAYLDG